MFEKQEIVMNRNNINVNNRKHSGREPQEGSEIIHTLAEYLIKVDIILLFANP